MLEYHFETLTSRSQETEFEGFARALIKLEICPNLLPQTGPTGGGDSKVDSETYPVAEALEHTWHIGVASRASSERWAFAFSAMKKWRPKLKSDIAKIAGTDRGYAKAFFVTNQYVRDKDRGELEDELREKHEIDVRILDRTWILDTVFDNGRQELAIEKLGISPQIRKERRLGPLDFQRVTELARLESRIQESASDQIVGFVTVDDCIEAAVISRELERPLSETEGRFSRAENMAAKYGSLHQRIRCAYDRAWTTFFWFEDIPKFAELYEVVESHAKDSQAIYDLELLTNLWMLLHGHAQDLTDYERHTSFLIDQLTAQSANKETPSAALQARAFLSNIAMARAAAKQESLDHHLREFSKIIKESKGLVGFPLLSLAETLMALGEFLGVVPQFDTLHGELVEVVARRKGEVEGARLRVQRAEQQLDLDRPVDAICTIGKALHCLAKEESQLDFCRALHACACAYERIGLLWAARGTMLAAASVSMSKFWKYQDVTPAQAFCLRRLKWIELQLGRIPQALSWHEIDSSIRGVLIAQGYDEEALKRGSMEFDAALGLLLLKTDFCELNEIINLPDQLSSMGLDLASVALLYALGHDTEFQTGTNTELEGHDDVTLFTAWRDLPAGEDLPEFPNLCNRAKVELRTSVLGCEFDVTIPNESPFIELGESLLAAIESALATGLVRRIVAREPKFTVTVKQSEFCKNPVEFAADDESDYPHLTVLCRKFDPDGICLDQQLELKKHLADMVASTIAYVVIPDKERVEQLFREDVAISRAIDFTGSFQVLGNVLGKDRKHYVSSWCSKNHEEYKVKRERAWDADCPNVITKPEHVEFAKLGETRPSEEDFARRMQTTRLNKMKTLSLIREPLWNKANWNGLGVVAVKGYTPILTLTFQKREPAKQIFRLWEKEIGEIDEAEALRVCIIRHINKQCPHHYRVLLGHDIKRARRQSNTDFIAVAQRVQTMMPSSSRNLDSFLHAYAEVGAYYLAPAVMSHNGLYPEPIDEFRILKRELDVREAWEIGLNDLDGAGILPGDEPIIPKDAKTVPVQELLKLKRSRPAEATANQNTSKSSSSSSKSRTEKRKKDKRKRQQTRKSRKRNR